MVTEPDVRTGSPLHAIDANIPTIKSTITFNYGNSNHLRPVTFQATEGNCFSYDKMQYSATTLVTLSGSVNSQEIKRKPINRPTGSILIVDQPLEYSRDLQNQEEISDKRQETTHSTSINRD